MTSSSSSCRRRCPNPAGAGGHDGSLRQPRPLTLVHCDPSLGRRARHDVQPAAVVSRRRRGSRGTNSLMPPLTTFVSYRRKDADEVRGLEAELRLRGIRTWRDVNDLHLGGATEKDILHGIATESDAFILYATPRLYERDSTFIWDK